MFGAELKAHFSRMFSKRVVRVMFYSFVTASSVSASTGTMTQEEVTVRRTYAKTQCAVQLRTLYEHVTRAHDPRSETPSTNDDAGSEQLTFELSDFRVGDISDVASTKYSELVTKPSGGADGLFITPAVQTYRVGDGGPTYSTNMAVAHWGKEQLLLEDWNIPMVEAVSVAEVNNASRFNRYASFAVTARFQSRVRRYRALFLFGTNGKGDPFVLAIDTVVNVNGSALSWFMVNPIVPDVFLSTRLKDNPAVRQWLEKHRQTNCDAKTTDVCCDLNRMECGWR